MEALGKDILLMGAEMSEFLDSSYRRLTPVNIIDASNMLYQGLECGSVNQLEGAEIEVQLHYCKLSNVVDLNNCLHTPESLRVEITMTKGD